MKTAVAFTSEIDDTFRAAKELCQDIKDNLTFEGNSCGFMYCDIDCDIAQLSKEASLELGIDIVGTTAMSAMEKSAGYVEMGVMLTVMTGDDVVFAPVTTGELTVENYEGQIKEAFAKATAEMNGNSPKVTFLFAPWAPELSVENMMDVLDELTGKIPIFGGVASDCFEMQHQKTFINGEVYEKGLVMVLVGGNIRPVFSVQHSFSTPRAAKGIITKSHDNVIEQVGDISFTDFLKTFGYVPEDGQVHSKYLGSPFLINFRNKDSDNIPVVRDLSFINLQEGSGVLMGRAPEDSILSIGMIKKENLVESCEKTLSDLFRKMEDVKEYDFSFIFLCSCAGRNLLMADTKDLESNILLKYLDQKESMRDKINIFSFYAFGEICPTSEIEGQAVNRLHNCSIVACAL